VCGEFAADPMAIPLLVGLGVDELSMSPPAIPRARDIVRTMDYRACRVLVDEALVLETANAVRAHVCAWHAQERRSL
jgi:phosphocarrier protein FPr